MKKIILLHFLFFTIVAAANTRLNVIDFGANGADQLEDTSSFQACVEALIKAGGGEIIIPKGNYYIKHVKFFGKQYSNITIIGEDATIHQIVPSRRVSVENGRWMTFAERKGADGVFVFDARVSGQKDDSNSIKNITIKGLTFNSHVEKVGFDELSHQISAHGVSNFNVENCNFIGFLGDGIAINAATDYSINRDAYNKDITITNCHFDGINKDNRQGISIYYADGFLIENCSFKNTTREDMPGALDIEPNADYQISRNGIIRNCTFDNIGGIGAIIINKQKKISSNLDSSTGFLIENCSFNNVRVALAVFGADDFQQLAKQNSYDVVFRNSNVSNYKSLFVARKASNVLTENVTYRNAQLPGYTDCLNEGSNILFRSCKFLNYVSDKDYCSTSTSKKYQFKNCTYQKKN
ncbi:MAG: hypothetical protein BGO40_06770 [Chryseobacterium sp. 39-10]|nr:hypothetical protein [Chryseobacterium sp.]OJV47986.1 MAG: hypothetical protein BGO40_06770 [Chryseobacterium sp. 39-10]